MGAGSLCVPSQGGPKPAPGWELIAGGALNGGRAGSRKGRPFGDVGKPHLMGNGEP